MKNHFPFDDAIHLVANRAVRVALAPSQKLVALDGTLWVTLEGDPNDYIVRAGTQMQPGGGAELVVQAMTPEASYRVSSTAEPLPAAAQRGPGRLVSSVS